MLLDHLLNKYDKRVRPWADHNLPVEIKATIVLGLLVDVASFLFNENQQLASFVISHTQQWTDPQLTWEPADWWNITEVTVPNALVWLPKLFIYNSVSTKDMLKPERYDIRLSYDGRIFVNIPQQVTSVCSLEVDLFPFDIQYCEITHASPLLTVHEQIVNVTDPPPESSFTGNPEYDIIDVHTCNYYINENSERRMGYIFVMHLKRRPSYYIIVMVVPTFLIAVLSVLGIFLTSSVNQPRTEKVTMGMGSLLSMIMMFGVIADEMPRTERFPLIGIYILAILMVIAAAIVVSTIQQTIHSRLVESGDLPSNCAYRLMLLTPFDCSNTKKYNCKNRMDRLEITEILENLQKTDLKLSFVVAYLQDIAASQRKFLHKMERGTWNEVVEIEWNRIFARMDIALLVLFQLTNAGVLFYFFYRGYQPPRPIPESL
ncbi:unnamed protein product [Bursaphelenchus xylophilus]|uniref:(pine wood nematode) hypothetical protein n=1 Tax=Bursaphelenchus xylophilus TaxID=6326 RepID=A0A1I7S5C6_BURXY|nr:unnamed protein product [Bursaphelenchus xylophilus]CAG9117928.1 unnamed protein product [Bursaphelenchus xylophilus]